MNLSRALGSHYLIKYNRSPSSKFKDNHRMLSTISRLASILVLATLTLVNTATAQPLSTSELQQIIEKANNDDIQAQADLANRYFIGDGVPLDIPKAATWYEKLANSGVTKAQLTLGLIYIKGDGVQQDNVQALHWLNMAAEQLSEVAQYLLGVAHAEGHGTKIDKVKAYMWYEVSAAMEYKDAIDARTELAKHLSKQEIRHAEEMATDWWLRFHQ